jgi:hypothetical protein
MVWPIVIPKAAWYALPTEWAPRQAGTSACNRAEPDTHTGKSAGPSPEYSPIAETAEDLYRAYPWLGSDPVRAIAGYHPMIIRVPGASSHFLQKGPPKS